VLGLGTREGFFSHCRENHEWAREALALVAKNNADARKRQGRELTYCKRGAGEAPIAPEAEPAKVVDTPSTAGSMKQAQGYAPALIRCERGVGAGLLGRAGRPCQSIAKPEASHERLGILRRRIL
jgi:hypothetical protein